MINQYHGMDDATETRHLCVFQVACRSSGRGSMFFPLFGSLPFSGCISCISRRFWSLGPINGTVTQARRLFGTYFLRRSPSKVFGTCMHFSLSHPMLLEGA